MPAVTETKNALRGVIYSLFSHGKNPHLLLWNSAAVGVIVPKKAFI